MDKKERQRMASRKHYINNRDKELRRVKKYHLEHSDERREYQAEYHKKRKAERELKREAREEKC